MNNKKINNIAYSTATEPNLLCILYYVVPEMATLGQNTISKNPPGLEIKTLWFLV